jgi:hypothetical protein
MLNFHLCKQGCDFGDEIEVILEEISFKHSREVLGNFLAFLNQ